MKWNEIKEGGKLPAFTYDVLLMLKDLSCEKTIIMQGYLLMEKWKVYNINDSTTHVIGSRYDVIKWAEIPK